MADIKTAVDSLIELVKKEKKPISIDKAAEQLNLPVVVVHEWASFLEEADVVVIEYKLSTPYLRLKNKKKTESDKQSKDDLQKERETLLIKTQANLKEIRAKREYLNWLKKQFIEIPESKKKSLAKPLAIVLDQKNLIEEAIFQLLIDMKNFNIKKHPNRQFTALRERFKKIEDRTRVFEQNLQKISNYMGSAR